jgi:cell division protein ZapE
VTVHESIPENIKLDEIQLSVADVLERSVESINHRTYFKKLSNFLKSSSKQKKGIYLHGGVGRGKTMLMRAFFARLDIPKEIIHYQNFMQEVHIKLHRLQSRYTDKVIEELASDITARTKVLCLDEFEIKDITDAMIIMRLFNYLVGKGVFIVLTTNTMPKDLYKDGIHRDSFLPFINMVEKDFMILHLDSDIDYRFYNISEVTKRVFYPINKEAIAEIDEIKMNLSRGFEVKSETIEVFGRKILFQNTCKRVLFTNFSELFEQEYGYADYVNICQHFQAIVLEEVCEIKEDESNLITRFINFIDNAYFYKVLLFITSDKAPEYIYTKGKKTDEFQRTISRLNEMNNVGYFSEKSLK